jgi:hypothetical protein
MHVECARLAPVLTLQCLDRKVFLPFGHQISHESVASERIAMRKSHRQIDPEVALEWI